MISDLDLILDADEEGRARVDASRRQLGARIEEVRRDAERRRTEEREAARRALEAEVDRVLADSDHEIADRKARRALYLAERDCRARQLLPRAAELFASILADGPPRQVVP